MGKLPRNYYNEAVAGIFNARQWGPVLTLLREAQEELDAERWRAGQAEAKLDHVGEYAAYAAQAWNDSEFALPFAEWLDRKGA